MGSDVSLPVRIEKVPADAKVAFGVLVTLAVIASLLDVGFIGWIVAPICILLGWFAIFRAPLRATMLTLMFCALVLENPSDIPAAGLWRSPLYPIGALLLTHFKTVIGGFWFFGGLDLMLLAATVTWFVRYRGRQDGISTPSPMLRLAQLVYVTIVFMWLVGKWRNGNSSMALWQIDRVMYLPAVFLLCQAAFRAPNDYIAVGKLVLVAAALRAALGIYVLSVVPVSVNPISGERYPSYVTTHHDSMLFAVAAVMLVALIMQRVPKAIRLLLLLGPLLVVGMVVNDRRMVWLQLIISFLAIYLVTDQNAFKRKLQRWALLAVPAIGLYVAVGWGSTSDIFTPVQIIRSSVDSSSDGSTAWRDLENFNLIYTLKIFPIFGTGYGNGFIEFWPLPQVAYSLERFVPHNSLLGLWCYGGFVGYTGLTLFWVGGVFFAIRAYHYSKVPLEKAAALTAFAMVVIYYIQCYGDLGLGTFTGVFLVGPFLAIACKLAVKSGAWPAARRAAPAANRFASQQSDRPA
jgi:hypothetical protein